MTIIGRPDLPPNTLAELVTYIKANGDKMTFGNAGLGAASHLCGMLFMTAAGKEILTVPYKGNAPVMNDLIAKQIDLTCDRPPIRRRRSRQSWSRATPSRRRPGLDRCPIFQPLMKLA